VSYSIKPNAHTHSLPPSFSHTHTYTYSLSHTHIPTHITGAISECRIPTNPAIDESKGIAFIRFAHTHPLKHPLSLTHIHTHFLTHTYIPTHILGAILRYISTCHICI